MLLGAGPIGEKQMTLSELQVERAKIIAEMSAAAEAHIGNRGMTRRSNAELQIALSYIDAQIVALLPQGSRTPWQAYIFTPSSF